MTAKDCIKGKNYMYSGLHLGKSDGHQLCKIYMTNCTAFTTGGSTWSEETEVREATEEESAWLEACIVKNTFVPLEEVVLETYPIF